MDRSIERHEEREKIEMPPSDPSLSEDRPGTGSRDNDKGATAAPLAATTTRRSRASTVSRVRAESTATRQQPVRQLDSVLLGISEEGSSQPAQGSRSFRSPSVESKGATATMGQEKQRVSSVSSKELEATLDVVDPSVSATNALNNMANNLVFPSLPMPAGLRRRTMTVTSRLGFDSKEKKDDGDASSAVTSAAGEANKVTTTIPEESEDADLEVWAPLNLVLSGHESLVDGSPVRVDDHFKEQAKLTKKQRLKAGLRALGKFAMTPLGFIVCFYAFNVVFWGAAIVFFLAGWIVQDPYQKARWVEITSQVENGLFCVTGLGFIPKRSWDTYLVCRVWYYKIKERKLLQAIQNPAEPKSNADLEKADSSSAPANYLNIDASAAEIASNSKLPEVSARRYAKCAVRLHKSNKWYKPFPTESHLEFPVQIMFWICLLFDGNSIFQILLCASMWGYNRFTRPPYQQGTLIPLSFLCGIIGGLLQWRIGERCKRKKKVIEEILDSDGSSAVEDSVSDQSSEEDGVFQLARPSDAAKDFEQEKGYIVDEDNTGEADHAMQKPTDASMVPLADRETINVEKPIARRLPSGLPRSASSAAQTTRRATTQYVDLDNPAPTLRRMSTSSAPFSNPTQMRRRSSTVTSRQRSLLEASPLDRPQNQSSPYKEDGVDLEEQDSTTTEDEKKVLKLEKPRRSQWRRPARTLGRTIFSAARLLYSLSFFLLIAIAGVATLGAGYDLALQAFRQGSREQKIIDAIVVLSSYIGLGLISVTILIARYYTVKRSLANIPKLYLPIKEHDVPNRVYTLITTEFARSSVIHHLSKPSPSPQPGWGQPGTPLEGVHFATSTKKALSTLAKNATEIAKELNERSQSARQQVVVPHLEPTMTAGRYLALLIGIGILPQSALPFAQVFAEAWDRAQYDDRELTAEEYLDVVKIVAVFIAMMHKKAPESSARQDADMHANVLPEQVPVTSSELYYSNRSNQEKEKDNDVEQEAESAKER